MHPSLAGRRALWVVDLVNDRVHLLSGTDGERYADRRTVGSGCLSFPPLSVELDLESVLKPG